MKVYCAHVIPRSSAAEYTVESLIDSKVDSEKDHLEVVRKWEQIFSFALQYQVTIVHLF